MDHELVSETLGFALTHRIFDAKVTPALADAVTAIQEWKPRFVVVDMDLGDTMLLRDIGLAAEPGVTTIPVLGVTRRADLTTRLEAFEQGVDDIMLVPFAPEEFLARMIAITRRVFGTPLKLKRQLTMGQFEIDILNRRVRAGNAELHLTSLERSLLYFLAANAGRIVTRDEIMDALWGEDFVAESNVVDRHVRSLRDKLNDDWRSPRYIATVPGRGYRFIPEPRG
jgi:DNA-binding response OmpR family regulator